MEGEVEKKVKQEISPAAIVVVIVVAVVLVGGYLWKSNADKPAYPGQDAKQPGSSSTQAVSGRPTADQARKMGFTGAQAPAAADANK